MINTQLEKGIERVKETEREKQKELRSIENEWKRERKEEIEGQIEEEVHTHSSNTLKQRSLIETQREMKVQKEKQKEKGTERKRDTVKEEGIEIETGKDLDGSAANCRLPKQHRSINQRKILDERMNMTKLNDKKV